VWGDSQNAKRRKGQLTTKMPKQKMTSLYMVENKQQLRRRQYEKGTRAEWETKEGQEPSSHATRKCEGKKG
jgi:hypothetical protein